MTPDSLQRLDALVLEAAALEGAERARLLRRAEAEDPALTFEARRLLRAENGLTAAFLRPHHASLLDALTRPPPEEPPADNQRYELGDCLGRGGMAQVYRAFDHKLDRTVALKVLTSRDPETPRRLLREARAQARVRHDHVLEVYDTGEIDGRAYIAVRYAAGGTLAELAPPVAVETRVRLLAQAADGLHAAHREGLLHGDVKPSNILVEETPDGDQAWVGDFGIAIEMAREGDGAGAVGTPRYMAPELLAAGAGPAPDRRADVYSLGVTLFEVLAGSPPPGPTPSWSELRTAAPDLPPDLLAVAGRCLARDPEDRYPSARAVAQDLRRFLEGDVVSAYADRRAYRWARFAARHRRLLTVAGISAALLAASLVVTTLMGVRAVRANAVAEGHRSQAEELIDFMLLDLRHKLEPVGRLDLLDDVGNRAMSYFAAAPLSEASDEELARRATALWQIGDVRLRQGDLAGAQRPLEESLALARELVSRQPGDGERLFGLGQSEFWVGYAHWERGNAAAAQRHFEAYEAISEELVALDPQRPDWRAELSYAHSNLGTLFQAQGDLEEALGRFQRTLAIDRELEAAAADPEEVAQRRFDRAMTHNAIGLVLERMGRLDAALESYGTELELRQALERSDPRNQRWRDHRATCHQYLGSLYLARAEMGPARRHLEASRQALVQLSRHDPTNGDWLYKLAWSELRMGRLEQLAGRGHLAEAAWNRAAELSRTLVELDGERFDWRLLAGVVPVYPARPAPDLAAAESAVDQLVPLVEARPEHRRARRWLAEALLLRGELAAIVGNASAARADWQRALTTLQPVAATALRDAQILLPREWALRRLGHTAEADALAATLESLRIQTRPPSSTSPDPETDAVTRNNLRGASREPSQRHLEAHPIHPT